MSYRKYTNSGVLIPSRLVRSPKRQNYKAKQSLKEDGSFKELLDILVDPHLYSLEYRHLGIDQAHANPKYLRDHLILKAWKMVLKEKIEAPYLYKFEVGRFGSGKRDLKVHLVADYDAGLLDVRRDGEVIKPIQDSYKDYKTVMAYFRKPDADNSDQAIAELNEALIRIKKEGKYKRLPYTSGYEWGIWK
jgi:DNA-binding transcriptional ArsR family regulator